MVNLGASMVLVDVGASGKPPSAWSSLLKTATYVGFDPDTREILDPQQRGKAFGVIVNKAVTYVPNSDTVHFFLTRSPFCSSTCQPNRPKLEPYLFADFFEVTRETGVPAVTLTKALSDLGLSRIDWLKLDTQGTDLRIYESVDQALKDKISLIDLEPGLDKYYVGEDVFGEVHKQLLEDGFWLSELQAGGTPRIRRDILASQLKIKSRLVRAFYGYTMKVSPTFVNARYMRTIEFLDSDSVSRKQILSAWQGAVATLNFPFALELAILCSRKFGDDLDNRRLRKKSVSLIRWSSIRNSYRLLKYLSPYKIRRFLTTGY